MIRMLLATCAVLAALCVFQWKTIGQLKEDLAGADGRAYHAALAELNDRRDEVTRVLTWLNSYSNDGDARNSGGQGICRDGVFEAGAVGRLLFDVYLRARVDGASEAEARSRVVEALRIQKSGN